MLPFEEKPWAKPLARFVIVFSILAAIVGAWYLYSIRQLYIPEITGILLLLLTIIPPNAAVLHKKSKAPPEKPVRLDQPHPHTR
jgi:uncharacterized membrane protein YfcA